MNRLMNLWVIPFLFLFCFNVYAKDVKVNFKSYEFTFKENEKYAFFPSESVAPGQIFIGDVKTNKVVGKMNIHWGQSQSTQIKNDCQIAKDYVFNQANKKMEFTQKNLKNEYLCLAKGLKASDGVSGFYIPSNTSKSGVLKPLLAIELSEGNVEDVAKWVKYE